MYDLKTLGLKIKEIRKQQKISQEKLAELTGLNLKTIIRIENAQGSPSVETLIKIANVLNTKITALFDNYEFQSREEIIKDINKCLISMNDEDLKKFYKSVYYCIR